MSKIEELGSNGGDSNKNFGSLPTFQSHHAAKQEMGYSVED